MNRETLGQLYALTGGRFFAGILIRILPIIAMELAALLLIRLFFVRVYVEAGGAPPPGAGIAVSAPTIGAGLLAFLLIRLVTGYAVSRSVYMLVLGAQRRVTTHLFANYLGQPYRAQRVSSRSEQRQTLFIAATAMVQQMLLPLVHLFIDVAVALAILILLLSKELVAAAALIAWLGFLLVAQSLATSPAGKRAGVARWAALNRMRMIADSALGDPRLTKLSASEDALTGLFSDEAGRLARAIARETALSQIPVFAREFVLVSAVCLLVAMMTWQQRTGPELVGAVALFGAASVRLLPALQRSVVFIQKLGTHASDLRKTHADRSIETEDLPRCQTSESRLERLELRDVSFGYSGQTPMFTHVDLAIVRGQRLLISGASGSGKSTLLLLACGLVIPDRGSVEIDGVAGDILARLRRGRAAFVPQDPFIGNVTVLENIAFPVSSERVDRAEAEALMRALCLTVGLDDPAGEDGARLSGGERQRVALLRALLQRPELLILDEATSQLDTATEAAVYRCIAETCADATIIATSHRQPPAGIFHRRLELKQGGLNEA